MLLSLYTRLMVENFTDTVVIDSGDTDVYVQQLTSRFKFVVSC